MINPVIILQKEIEKLQDFAIQNKLSFINEETTKQTLILPFIKILGFDSKNPNEVMAEFSPHNAPNSLKVDYCICINNKKSVFIEAKSYNKNIDRYVEQMEKYYNASDSVEYGILTNGISYYFFTSSGETDNMLYSPFFEFNLLDYSIDDLETLVAFTKKKYNYRDMRILSYENRITNKMTKSLYDLLGNPDESKEFLHDDYKGLPSDTVSRLIPIAMERAVIKRGEEYEIERRQKVILRYSLEQLSNLGRFENIDAIGHKIFIPSRKKFDELIRTNQVDYCVEKGNPFSDFFIAAIYSDKKNIQGYLIGHYLNTFDDNGNEDVMLYCAPWDNIASFVKDNPIVNDSGFINAKFIKRTNKSNGNVSYYLQSNISGVTFQNFPKLVVEMSNFDEFYQEFFA